MRGLPVVKAEEMKRIEFLAFEEGESELQYMENAGSGIAAAVEEFLITPRVKKEIYLLVGKGNNGGDAFVAGEHLLKKGFSLTAYCLYPIEECSPLSQKMCKRFEKAGGEVALVREAPTFEDGVILDGLVGTGFQGAASGVLAEVIEGANHSGLPIFAIDIPSGLNGNTGAVETIAIEAKTTIYLGLPKIGFFQGQGWNHVGKLLRVDFGLPEKYVENCSAVAYLVSEKKAARALPKLIRNRHKYQAGYVLTVAGSIGMPGAAIMSCLAALRAGAGIVRLFHPEKMRPEFASAPYELIREEWNLKDTARIMEEAKRAKALVVGPGMGRTKEAHQALSSVLSQVSLPTVIDADALYFLAQDPKMPLPEEAILTPHHQEMERLIGMPPTFENCQSYAKEKKVTLVLKGGPTVIFTPYGDPLIVAHGDPGMATAGTGDVLTGILGAFLAQGLSSRDSAALGVLLHALAGEIAADSETSYSLIATDLIHYLPDAFIELGVG